ncbi:MULTISPECIES: MarR family transcriptional regulator [unclassified Streptomyces]|uniref:MarR family winged helix-turn-helix transcriptional regulator n=1 Tax=unclassified Streptomyces TaxID=2593676 RepID=UPI000DB92041|nr:MULTISPECIES: MarR family transcriptional regulator [unclassified Streptomyces]MYT74636.1 MarR family transcriptional regulator [Streptomyces sp. SID8367]RAJ91620.1 DNA-binding MarR family transcriptional regulator [Streptomyces sp. PsTaAH-137]
MEDSDGRLDPIGPLEDPRPSLAADTTAAVDLLVGLWTRTAKTGTPQLSALQLHALHTVRTTPGLNLGALAGAIGTAPSAASRLCDRLEAAGMILRAPPPTNRRTIGLTLTRRGQDALDAVSARRERLLSDVLDRMPSDKRGALLTGLRAFATASRAADPEASQPG